MLGFLEGPDLIIVAVIVLLVFGGSKIPQLARSLGEAQREFRRAAGDDPTSSTPARGESAAGTPAEPSGDSATATPDTMATDRPTDPPSSS